MEQCHFKRLASKVHKEEFDTLNKQMSFAEYIDLVYANPLTIRTAYQKLYDMIVSEGTEEIFKLKNKLTHYKFFDNPEIPIFGLEETLDELVKFFRGAAGGYGTEKRVLLLHGPVGSSKSTILRRLKKGMERYSRTPEGAWYSFKWVGLPTEGNNPVYTNPECNCPMHEEPLKLIPIDIRAKVLEELNEIYLDSLPENKRNASYKLRCDGEIDPRCRKFMVELMNLYEGDWEKVVSKHIVVVRKVYSEADRCGIATFQPKDEKNQDATELTGDINFRQIAFFGSDSDSRAFSFDGELCCGNRGLIEFIEMLKLAQEFLYDLLGASQERQIKPKKFPQISIDEVLIGHSVAGDTPIPYLYDDKIGWMKLENLYETFENNTDGLSVLAYDFEKKQSKWTPVRSFYRHKFSNKMLRTCQKWGVVETTPNHSIYNKNGETFFPADKQEVMAVRQVPYKISTEVIDLSVLVPELVGEKVTTFIKNATKGTSRINAPRFSTTFKTYYDPIIEVQPLKDLLTLLAWYIAEGHINDDGGIVISQADKNELLRVQKAVSNLATSSGCITGPYEDGCYRLALGAKIFAVILEKLCGRYSENKRIPDFVFGLSEDLLAWFFAELKITDGSDYISEDLNCSEEYRNDYFEYKTVSSMLASQVGFLTSILYRDYSVYNYQTVSDKTAYRIRYVNPNKRHKACECRLIERDVEDIWVYDIECEDIHNFVCGVGLVVCHNTNSPEFKKLQNNTSMEALKDRTVKIDVPYLLKWSDEIKVLEQDYGSGKVRQHVSPHTLEIAALWTVLTRLSDEERESKLTLVQKARLYNGEAIPGYNEDTIRELKDKYALEGMERGISARYTQDKISNCLSNNHDYINVFMVLHEIKVGLDNHTLINKKEDLAYYHTCVDIATKELDEILKDEVRKALVGDEKVIERLCANYIDHILAYIKNAKVKNKVTGRDEKPNERLMRSIEEKIGIPDQGVDDFRRTIAAFIGDLAHENKKFHWNSNVELRKALEAKLFEDTRDHIKLSALNVAEATVTTPEIQEKIDAIKKRLIDQYGYNEQSATDVLEYVGSIFARMQADDDK